jgi:hypothetical protein
MPSRIALALLVLFALAGCADRALACSCAMGTIGDAYRSSTAVFVGRVTEVVEEPLEPLEVGDREFPRAILWAKLEVEERFKGVDGAVVVVSPGEKNSSCTVDMEVGHRYLVFARLGTEDAKLYTGACDPTAAVEHSARTLTYCRRVARDGKVPCVIGMLVETSPSSTTEIYEGDGRAVGGISVTLERSGKQVRAVTDRDGVFYFDDVPDGEYEVRFALPEGYRLLDINALNALPTDGSAPKHDTVQVSNGSTVTVSAQVTTSGSISGRFVDASGKALAGIRVALVPRDRMERPTMLDLIADEAGEDGTIRFDPLPPGEYALVVNWPLIPRLDRPPVPSFWRADAADPKKSAIFSITPGRHVDLGVVKAPPPPPHVVVDVTILDEAGQPVPGALNFEDENHRYLAMPVQFEAGAATRLYLPTGRSWTLRAAGYADDDRLESELVTIDPAAATPTVKIVVRKVRR